MYLSDYFTVPMSLAGIPAISIPAGLAAPPAAARSCRSAATRRPAFRESLLLDAAHALGRDQIQAARLLRFASGAGRSEEDR